MKSMREAHCEEVIIYEESIGNASAKNPWATYNTIVLIFENS